MFVYLTLFVTAFAAASLLPVSSELLLIGDLKLGYDPLGLWLTASLGNTLGSLLNYQIGKKGEAYLEKRGHLDSRRIARYVLLFRRWGGWLLLLSWMPIVGDPITLVAGFLHYELKRFMAIVFIAKALRYAVMTITATFL